MDGVPVRLGEVAQEERLPWWDRAVGWAGMKVVHGLNPERDRVAP